MRAVRYNTGKDPNALRRPTSAGCWRDVRHADSCCQRRGLRQVVGAGALAEADVVAAGDGAGVAGSGQRGVSGRWIAGS